MCKDETPCRFQGEGIVCGVERDTQRQIMEHLSENSVVLEVGARYGTVSCAISKQLGYSGLRVSIEPDADAFNTLNANADRNNCNGLQVNGVVSQTNATMAKSGVIRDGITDDEWRREGLLTCVTARPFECPCRTQCQIHRTSHRLRGLWL
jgi:FkbM family methyltransferase